MELPRQRRGDRLAAHGFVAPTPLLRPRLRLLAGPGLLILASPSGCGHDQPLAPAVPEARLATSAPAKQPYFPYAFRHETAARLAVAPPRARHRSEAAWR
ncbi:MAG: hypothetical protein JO306_10810 [Gemmatimonadetes bacterium]|nr:hypothetical protein [Gemmatimonadota bacterium]